MLTDSELVIVTYAFINGLSRAHQCSSNEATADGNSRRSVREHCGTVIATINVVVAVTEERMAKSSANKSGQTMDVWIVNWWVATLCYVTVGPVRSTQLHSFGSHCAHRPPFVLLLGLDQPRRAEEEWVEGCRTMEIWRAVRAVRSTFKGVLSNKQQTTLSVIVYHSTTNSLSISVPLVVFVHSQFERLGLDTH